MNDEYRLEAHKLTHDLEQPKKGFTIICNACGSRLTFEDADEYYLKKTTINVAGDTEYRAQIDCKCGNHVAL